MNKHGRLWGLVALALSAGIGSARAEPVEPNRVFELGPIALHGDEGDVLQLGVGAFDFDEDQRSAAAHVEYRIGRKLAIIGPTFGILGNTDGGLFGYVGAYGDISWGSVYLTPQLAFGGYREGAGKDLGGVFQFRQSADLSWRFAGGSRLGVRMAHLSNANVQDLNPGENEIYLTYAIPLGSLF